MPLLCRSSKKRSHPKTTTHSPKRPTKPKIRLSMKQSHRIRCHRRLKPSVSKNTKLNSTQKLSSHVEQLVKTQSQRKTKMRILLLRRRPRQKRQKLNQRLRLWMMQTIRLTDQKPKKQRMRMRQKPQLPQLPSLTLWYAQQPLALQANRTNRQEFKNLTHWDSTMRKKCPDRVRSNLERPRQLSTGQTLNRCSLTLKNVPQMTWRRAKDKPQLWARSLKPKNKTKLRRKDKSLPRQKRQQLSLGLPNDNNLKNKTSNRKR